MKKIVALALCLVMVIGLMAGCEKAMDAKTLVQKMDEAMKGVTEFGGNLEMDMEMSIKVSGITMTMEMGMDMDVRADKEFKNAYMDMNVAVKAMGESEELGMEVYMNTEDDKLVTYMHDGSTDTWTKSAEGGLTGSLTQSEGLSMKFSEMPLDQMTLAKEKETVGGRECYVLTVNTPGTYFQEQMDAAMEESKEELEAMDEESRALVESMMEGIDWTALSAEMVYYVDAETFLPVKLTGELDGMSELMNGMFSGFLAGMMMDVDSEEMEFSIEIPTVKFVATELTYKDVEIPAVPQEGIDNAIDADAIVEDDVIVDDIYDDESLLKNPPQEDGSYILTLGEDSVRVVLPEGYTPVITEAEWMNVCAADGMNEVYYELLQGMTDADMRAYVEGDVAWAKEEGAYQSHGDGEEFAGFTTMSLVLNDGTVFYYAWKELDSCLLSVEAWAYTAPVDMDALLTDVEILSK